MKLLTAIAIFLSLLPGTALLNGQSAVSQTDFKAAIASLENGEWPTAIETFETMVDAGVTNYAIHQNLAVAYWNNNEPGPARFNAERALLLKPRAEKTLNLLSEITSLESLPTIDPDWLSDTLRSLTPNAWLILIILFFWAWLGLWISRAFFKVFPNHDSELRLAQHLSLVAIVLLSGAFWKTYDWYHEAIITEDDIILKLAPTEQSPTLRPLAPGEKVSTAHSHNDHVYILTPDGTQGWIPESAAQRLWK
ncbi:MAG: hypothetical protein MK080_11255 [Opitutales bacterium]|nr:hypothetical protein [Opitutales bacterium]NRA26394.1 hypothetical protein [Opitutales bacterium]